MMAHRNHALSAVGPLVEAAFLGALWLALSPIHVANFILRLAGRQGSA
jgi:hypothetical protein